MFCSLPFSFLFFFFNDPATTEIYTLSLHDALPISEIVGDFGEHGRVIEKADVAAVGHDTDPLGRDRKSTRLNSSHQIISYAVFCLKKKKKKKAIEITSKTTITIVRSINLHTKIE